MMMNPAVKDNPFSLILPDTNLLRQRFDRPSGQALLPTGMQYGNRNLVP
jgi:hypothetical protein